MSMQHRRELFTKEQRKLFIQYPEGEWSIGSYYTSSKYDLEIIKNIEKKKINLNLHFN